MDLLRSGLHSTRSAPLLLGLLLTACAAAPPRVCPEWRKDGVANLTLRRDHDLADKLEWTLIEAWVDGQLPREYGAHDGRCDQGEPVARFAVSPGVHELVVASEFRGRGWWLGPTWKTCVVVPLEVMHDEVAVLVAPQQRAAVVPEERVGMRVDVTPSAARRGKPTPSDIRRALPLCHSFYGPSR